MKLASLLKQLDKLNLPKSQYLIVSSGALAAHGIREARDLDILVSDQLWQELIQKYPIKSEDGIDKIVISDAIDVAGPGSIFRDPSVATLTQVFETAEVIDGIKYMDLKLLKKFKMKLGREKDLKDIELINDYLSNH